MINRHEFEKIILSEDFLSVSMQPEIKDQLLSIDPAVKAMDGFEHRNPHHCYDLLEHTIHTVNSINCDNLTDNEICLIRTAAFFHDIGKPDSAIEKPGKLVFYGHAKKSAEIALPILLRLGFSAEEAARIQFFIRNHDMFISFVLPTDDYDRNNVFLKVINRENVFEAMADAAKKEKTIDPDKNDFLLLLRLCEADAMAQSEFVYNDSGDMIDSREHKLAKFRSIREIIGN